MGATFQHQQMSKNDILNLKVSYQDSAFAALSKELSIQQVLDEIKNGIHANQVHRLRDLLNSGDKEGYNSHKKNLAGVTFCGTFQRARRKTELKQYNYLVVLDIDKLSADEMQAVKSNFSADKFVFAFWESPSKQGVKGLVHLSFNAELNATNLERAHKGAFSKLKNYFTENYNVELDISGSDTTRLCFLSYDPDLIEKSEVFSYDVSESEFLSAPLKKEKSEKVKVIHKSSKEALYSPKGKNEPNDRKTMNSILNYLVKRKLSITNSYEEWYKVAFAIANTFTFDVGLKYFLQLSSIDTEKFNAANCENLMRNCYETNRGEIGFNKIKSIAIEKGYITKRIREGSSEPVLTNVTSEVSTS